MSSTLSKEVSKGTDGSAVAVATADDKSVWQANKPLIQLAVFTGCGVACGFAFEKARGTSKLKLFSCRCIILMVIFTSA